MLNIGLRPIQMNNAKICAYRSRYLGGDSLAITEYLKSFGIKTIVDLRKPSERKDYPDQISKDFNYICFDFDLQNNSRSSSKCKHLRGQFLSEVPGQRMLNMYRGFAHKQKEISQIISICQTLSKPYLIHCTNGKDRAGIISACLQKLNGVSRQIIFEDYLLSNQFNFAINLKDFSMLPATLSDNERLVIKSLFEARQEYLEAFIAELNCTYKSFHEFLRKEDYVLN